ncbi:glycosyltransferase family 4 protein [Sphingomonas sp. TREG-RG-20F-R18-01]|uniref:glycosyltransferase family 4 protein n=1 Tax=Sphingomonas sp. TREG-RG-20F-R18-01 TaxID=2914982 RepID=UPI001F59DC38|nr:glycosyltransferase family 4 protein [Sphingomonas sp. TREG-RG-20F-R18-01]
MATSPTFAPLRIAQVAPVIFPVPPIGAGGTERVVYDLTEALVAQGHAVTLFAPEDSRTSARLRSAGPSLAALERDFGRVAPGVPAALEAMQLDLLRAQIDTFDIVHCHGEFAHAAVLGKARARSITTVHWRLDEHDRQLFFGHFCDLPVAAISASQARALPTANLAGIVHHGIDRDRYALGDGAGGYLAFIGRMTDQKRPDRAIAVANGAGRSLRLAGAIDVGNPTYFASHVAPALGRDIVHVGELDDAGKQDLLGNAAALLFPIDWPEPFGLVMIEAMACGTPVIAWDKGSVPEIVEHGITGFVVSSEAEAIAAVGKAVRLDRAEIRRRFEARFTADRMARDYVDLYTAQLARARG